MAIAPILAITAAEMEYLSDYPGQLAWMACHFSPYGLGLSNLPKYLPPGSLLMLDDVTPPNGHDPSYVAQQLSQCAEEFQCCGVLLDFQRPGCKESAALVKYLVQALPCLAAVSESYAEDVTCPVLLPPPPLSVPLQKYLTPWKEREIWLELGLNGEQITLTEKGCQVIDLSYPGQELTRFADSALHCHYSIQTNKTSACFTLWRTMDDLAELLAEAEKLGISGAIGLYQELYGFQ